jgi:hypothetical protein
LSKFWLYTLNLCVFTKFGFIAHMLLLIAHVLLLTAHRSLLVAHKIASLMYSHVKATISKVFVGANSINTTCDEVSTINNGLWILIHTYIV